MFFGGGFPSQTVYRRGNTFYSTRGGPGSVDSTSERAFVWSTKNIIVVGTSRRLRPIINSWRSKTIF